MAIYDTTNLIDSSIYMKANLEKNKIGENYYIQSLQEKRDRDWLYRSNLIDIEEELEKQVKYTKELPSFTPIDVAIRSVKNEKGQDLGTEWADIAFKDLNHKNGIGSRYRFFLDFEENEFLENLTEEEKYYNSSIWLCINKNPISAGNNCIIRHCNSSIGLVGSPNLSYDNINEIHYEPIVLDNELKYINLYYNMNTVIPQAEWYATMQMNYFSNSIKINDRVIFGGVDLQDKENNAVYKVKAVVKSASTITFSKNGSSEIEKIPLIVIAFDKDTLNKTDDDFYNRIAEQAPIYFSEEIEPTYSYYINLQKDYDNKILLGEEKKYQCNLFFNDKEVKNVYFNITATLIEITRNLNSVKNEFLENEVFDDQEYYILRTEGENNFYIKNLKQFNKGKLRVTCICETPDGDILSKDFDIELGGFY